MPALLCETVTGRTQAELIAARDRATAGDMVELRLDGVAGVDVAGALNGRSRPAIVTCRPVWEGGRFDGSEEERRRILTAALAEGAEYVDIEWKAGFDDLIRANARRVVISLHDFAGVPVDLGDRVRAMRAAGTAVIKVAITAIRLDDTLPLFDIAREGDAVVIGMGGAGVASRLLASRFGSRWTYAGDAIAPGQVPIAQMVDRFRFRNIGPRTAVYGVVGNNVLESLSPAMHNAAFAAAGIDAVYVPLLAADFDDFLTFAHALRVVGASVTIPFKLDALRVAQTRDAVAASAGAANTLKWRGAGWDATNTDVAGFLEPLDRLGVALSGARISLLGAGGAARAVIAALASRDAIVTLHARRAEQAEEIASGVGGTLKVGAWPPDPGSWDVLINGTPVGGSADRDASPLAGGPFGGRVVYDLTYGPGESRLVREARAAGCLTLDGLPMLIAQAERQFEWWTGRRPQPGVMEAAAGRPGPLEPV